MIYVVAGGVFTDTDWKTLEGEPEVHGPFDTYGEALNVWRGKMGWNVDTCTHRLFIKGIPKLG